MIEAKASLMGFFTSESAHEVQDVNATKAGSMARGAVGLRLLLLLQRWRDPA